MVGVAGGGIVCCVGGGCGCVVDSGSCAACACSVVPSIVVAAAAINGVSVELAAAGSSVVGSGLVGLLGIF